VQGVKIKGNEMDEACIMDEADEKWIRNFSQKTNGRYRLGDEGINRRIILKCFLKDTVFIVLF
jgi:hypothetical protein